MKHLQALAFSILITVLTFIPIWAQKSGGDSHRKPQDSAVRDSIKTPSADLKNLRRQLLYGATARDDSIRINAWRQLQDIGPAVTIHPLDGPDDIIEKVEIIEDRIDTISKEKGTLEDALDILSAGKQAWEVQIEVLEDLSGTNRDSDTQLQQRLHDLQEDVNRIVRRIRTYTAGLSEIEKEYMRLKNVSRLYLKLIKQLRQKEDERS